jgi:hypothetical protein
MAGIFDLSGPLICDFQKFHRSADTLLAKSTIVAMFSDDCGLIVIRYD